jgi:hypothetical protein
MTTFESGAKSSEPKPRYDLLPIEGIARGAIRMAEGAATHGERNFERGANDAAFIKDRICHLVEHSLHYAQGDTSTDHLGACMLARLEVLTKSSPDATGDSTEVRQAPPGSPRCPRWVQR